MTNAENLIDTIAAQETALVFSAFDENTAVTIGGQLVEAARRDAAPVVINIRTADRVLFHAALPGSTPDNDHWARRKSNVTLRYHKASMRVGESFRLKGQVVGPDLGLDPLDFASHGGSFPVRVKGVGVIAAITVSGLASIDDHTMIVTVLKAFLSA
ncbi:MAG: heme-degrading domain-containing protein [Allorhizobium sp.]